MAEFVQWVKGAQIIARIIELLIAILKIFFPQGIIIISMWSSCFALFIILLHGAKFLYVACHEEILWINTTYQAIDHHIDIDRLRQCRAWRLWWNAQVR